MLWPKRTPSKSSLVRIGHPSRGSPATGTTRPMRRLSRPSLPGTIRRTFWTSRQIPVIRRRQLLSALQQPAGWIPVLRLPPHRAIHWTTYSACLMCRLIQPRYLAKRAIDRQPRQAICWTASFDTYKEAVQVLNAERCYPNSMRTHPVGHCRAHCLRRPRTCSSLDKCCGLVPNVLREVVRPMGCVPEPDWRTSQIHSEWHATGELGSQANRVCATRLVRADHNWAVAYSSRYHPSARSRNPAHDH
jgi:hypothetical protein